MKFLDPDSWLCPQATFSFKTFFMFMNVFSACASMHRVCVWCSWRPDEVVNLIRRFWKSNLGL